MHASVCIFVLIHALYICSKDGNTTSKKKMVPSEPVITPTVNFMILNDTVSLCEAMYCNVLLVLT